MIKQKSSKQFLIQKKILYIIASNLALAKDWEENAPKRCFGSAEFLGSHGSRCHFAPVGSPCPIVVPASLVPAA